VRRARTIAMLSLSLLEFRDNCHVAQLAARPPTLAEGDDDDEEGTDSDATADDDAARGRPRRAAAAKKAAGRGADADSDATEEDAPPRRCGGGGARRGGGGDSSTDEDAPRGRGGARRAAVVDSDDDEDEEESGAEYEAPAHKTHCSACSLPSNAEAGELLLCAGCDSAAHQSCALLRNRPRGDWFCGDCIAAPCPKCNKPVPTRDSIICGPDEDAERKAALKAGRRPRRPRPGCDTAFHPACVGLKRAPDGSWYCAKCA
jgi:hypothetical protein